MNYTARPLPARLISLAALLCLSTYPLQAAYDIHALENVETKAAAVAKMAGPCVVGLTRKLKNGMHNGSGVIVSRNGLILTAAHVVRDAEEINVIFPDGTMTRARVLGADRERDTALAQITEPGDYPFASLSEAEDPKEGDMIIAMGHGGGFNPQRPAPVRVGYIVKSEVPGMMRSSASMMGGDSGGPAFNLDGKIVGVHHAGSAGDIATANLDAPVSAVRSAWDRMIAGERWGNRGSHLAAKAGEAATPKPAGKPPQKMDGADKPGVTDPLKEISGAMAPGLNKAAPSVVWLLDGDKPVSMGTVVRKNGFILTKHSEIANAKDGLKVRTADGRELPAVEVKAFEDHDLALVKVDADHLSAIAFESRDNEPQPGRFVFTPGIQTGKPMAAMGVVSTPGRSLKEAGGYLGAELEQGGNCLKVCDAIPRCPAAKAGLQMGDVILGIGDHPVTTAVEFTRLLVKYQPGSTVKLKYRRGDEEKTAEATLIDRSLIGDVSTPAGMRGPKVSRRRNGFPMAFQNDQLLKPAQCGGILLDLHGEVIGVNIARDSRIGSYAIPSKTVAELLKGVDFSALEKTAGDKRKAS